jgi:hypothetical protein
MEYTKTQIMLRNLGAIVLGTIIGAMVNGGIVGLSGSVITPPEGADLTTMKGLAKSIYLFEPKHYLMPFLAHALGTFVGAFVAAYVAGSFKMRHALIIGAVFLFGGIKMVMDLPSAMWFNVLDLVVAYIPMAYIAGTIATKRGK